jgi:hypothetical protein
MEMQVCHFLVLCNENVVYLRERWDHSVAGPSIRATMKVELFEDDDCDAVCEWDVWLTSLVEGGLCG